MSGFEIVGLITALISVVATIEDLYSTLRDENNLPQAFHDIAARLPLVRDTLRVAEQNIDPNADEKEYQAMRVAVDNSKVKADKLEKIFQTIAPSDAQSRIERYRRAVRRWGKGNKVEDLAKGMMEDVRTLAMNRAVQTATQAQVAELLEAIKEISNIQPSLSDDESVSLTHTGAGDNVAGNKYQGNHNEFNGRGGNAYFGNVTQNVILPSHESRPVVKDKSNIDTCLRILPNVKGNSTVIEDCEPATWILEDDTYRSWFHHMHQGDETAALLILRGKVGIGKSVLMRQLATNTPFVNDDMTIRIHHSFQPESVMAAGPELMRRDSTMLKLSLLSSLVNQFPIDDSQGITDLAAQLRQMTNPAAWDECDLDKSILDILRDNKAGPTGLNHFRIFIDGLEECSAASPVPVAVNSGSLNNEAPKVLRFVSKLLKHSHIEGIDMGVCLSRGYFKDDGVYEPIGRVIELEKPMSAAVHRYIIRRLEKLPKIKFTDVLNPTFSFSLRRRSTNGFLWASMVTEGILHAKSSTTGEEYRRLAEAIPDNFHDFYTKSLELISLSESREESLNYLRLVLGAARSLSSEEFRQASAYFRDTDDNDNQLGISSAPLPSSLNIKDRIRQTTMGLIEVAEVNKSLKDMGQWLQPLGDMVRFIHPSVINFLHGEKSLQYFYPQLSANLNAECHLFMFQVCMRALKSCTLSEKDDITFTKYAFEFWPIHAKNAEALLGQSKEAHVPDFMLRCNKNRRGTKLDRIIEEQIKHLKFIQAQEFILLARNEDASGKANNDAASVEERPSMLVLLATLGCTTLVLQHLHKCSVCGGRKPKAKPSTEHPRLSVSDQQLAYALNNAIVCGHTDTANLLLEIRSGEDLSSLSSYSSRFTIFYQACYFEQSDIVESLLSKGADPTERSPFPYEYPLNAAIVTGNVKLINILLNERQGNRKEILEMRSVKTGYTALHFAVTTSQTPKTKLAALKAVVECAPNGLGLLKLEDAQGRTPLELAEELPEETRSDILDVLDAFEEDDEVDAY